MKSQTGETPMAREHKDYEDIPGTFVFDQERSRQGYGINMFCMSLMKEDNRKAFKANEAEYLTKFKLTPEQTDAVLRRDYNRMLELGGNIYFTAKLGATDGHSIEGNRSKSGKAKSGKTKSSKAAAAKPARAAKKTKPAKPKSKVHSKAR